MPSELVVVTRTRHAVERLVDLALDVDEHVRSMPALPVLGRVAELLVLVPYLRRLLTGPPSTRISVEIEVRGLVLGGDPRTRRRGCQAR